MISCLSVNVNAGVEPSPFRPEEGQLFSISNSLGAFILEVDELVNLPENPQIIIGYLEGKANQLRAIINNLELQQNRLDDILPRLPEGVLYITDYYGLVSSLYLVYHNSYVLEAESEFLMQQFPDLENEFATINQFSNQLISKIVPKIPYLIRE